MIAVQFEPRAVSAKMPLGFSLPKYTNLEVTTPVPRPLPQLECISGPAIFKRKHPVKGTIHLPEILTPITPLSPAFKRPTILTIPPEIRLEIYNYVLLSHPIHHAHLSKMDNQSLKEEEFHTSMLRPQGFPLPSSSPCHLINTSRTPADPPTHKTRPYSRLPNNRGKIPTSLLIACRQIYVETHLLPFTTGHFAFVNCFWSGVYAARQFSRSLRPWQSSTLRYVSVEVLGRDLWIGGMERLGGETGGSATVGNGNGKGTGEWRELCELLEGVRILRLSVKGSVILGRRATDLVGLAGCKGEERKSDGVDRPALNEEKRKQCERGILDVRMEWVTHGLHEMKNLREIELLIEDEDVDREVKLAFCAELEFFLTEGRSGDANWTGGVRVLLIEQIASELQGNQATGHGEQ